MSDATDLCVRCSPAQFAEANNKELTGLSLGYSPVTAAELHPRTLLHPCHPVLPPSEPHDSQAPHVLLCVGCILTLN
jgi:hypothetical protein